ARAQYPDGRGPDRSALHIEREAVGAHAVAVGPLRQARQTRRCREEDLGGTAREDGWDDPLAGKFLSEKVQEAGLHRIERRASAQDSQLSSERRPAGLTDGIESAWSRRGW